ncbi:cyclodeaminase/cyclohydrolase family protein [Herbiconiux liangxiaofengii]|uniref:cyclodeaminase/cyclohydrolase family protein n=1 Tax=Herbiconiux liangxiaofengii TaxID=3342795 RepID=UPI0035B9FA2B
MSPEIGATTGGSTVHDWMRRLAEPVGDPGGGAASGVMLAMGCALTSMVAGYAMRAAEGTGAPGGVGGAGEGGGAAGAARVGGGEAGGGGAGDAADGSAAGSAGSGRAAVAGRAEAVAAIRARAEERRERALELADVDARRSKQFGAAYHQPAGERRDAAVRSAGSAAARASDDLALLALDALTDLEELAPLAPAYLRPDVGVAAAALRAAITGARTNLAADLAELTRHGAEPPEGLTADLARFDEALARLDRV